MEDKELDTQEVINKVKEYVEVRKELAVLSAVEKGSEVLAKTVTGVILGLLGFFTLLFGSLALGFYLSERIGDTYSGFLIVTGFYLLITILIFMLKDKYMEKPIVNGAIKKFFSEKTEQK
jgi:hypothetical protein